MVVSKKEIHSTQLDTLWSCQAKYMFAYELGIRRPGSGHLQRGACYHDAMAHNFKQKEASFVDLPVDEVVDAYDTAWAEGLEQREIEWGEYDPAKMKDGGERMLRKYMESLAKERQPYPDGVEASHVVPIVGTNFELHFRIDFAGTIFKKPRLVDDKTASSKWRAGKELHQVQAYTYPLAWEAVSGVLLPMEFHVNIDRKKDGEISIVPGALTRNRYLWFRDWWLPSALEVIESGRYMPTGRGWECSEKWCGFWPMCLGGKNVKFYPMYERGAREQDAVEKSVLSHRQEGGTGNGVSDVQHADEPSEDKGLDKEGI